MTKKYDFSHVYTQYQSLQTERSEWEQEWRQVSDYLLPGRGIYQTYSKPRKRKLTAPRVINTVGEDSLYVLTSGMHGGLTSPSRPWFSLTWSDANLQLVEPLKAWLQDCQDRLHAELHKSNFYSIINSFYIEYAGFGTGCMYIGEDTGTDDVAFRFELLTAGEYAFSMGADGKPSSFFRTIFMTPRQLVERFPDTASEPLKRAVNNNEGTIDRTYITVLECIYKDKFQDKKYTRLFYEVTATSSGQQNQPKTLSSREPLEISGFYEFPYPLARWGTIGSDIYGIGPGSRALPDIKRAQEMEKAFLMATHKAIDPPLNIPSRLRGKFNSLPGGENYYANPGETVNELYQMRFDYQGVSAAIERVEQRIQKNFFNDIFLTASRDPNASPLKARQVDAQDQEKMLRLGPVIERLQHEFLQPTIERCFNIMMRKELFLPLQPELAQLVGDYDISLVSPLATAQRSVALQGINSFMAFIGQAAQFDQQVLDKVDIDAAVDEYADITGVKVGVIRPQEQVQQIRQQRQQQMMEKEAKAEAAAAAAQQSQMNTEQATASKTQAEAGQAMIDGQAAAMEAGIM